MSLFADPTVHAANPPETWEVVKVAHRCWQLRPAGEPYCLNSFTTRKAALEAKGAGFYFDLWHKEARWYAGEEVIGWRPYAVIAREHAVANLVKVPDIPPHRIINPPTPTNERTTP